MFHKNSLKILVSFVKKKLTFLSKEIDKAYIFIGNILYVMKE